VPLRLRRLCSASATLAWTAARCWQGFRLPVEASAGLWNNFEKHELPAPGTEKLRPRTVKLDAAIRVLEEYGPDLQFRMSSDVNGSRHSHMRELRVQVRGKPFRVLYAFNPERAAILLVGGDKTGNKRWYEVHVPKADKLYDQHLRN
jgi:hypothetical protein